MTDPRTPSAVRFSAEERALLHEAARAVGMPLTTYIRVAALEKAKRDIKAEKAKQ